MPQPKYVVTVGEKSKSVFYNIVKEQTYQSICHSIFQDMKTFSFIYFRKKRSFDSFILMVNYRVYESGSFRGLSGTQDQSRIHQGQGQGQGARVTRTPLSFIRANGVVSGFGTVSGVLGEGFMTYLFPVSPRSNSGIDFLVTYCCSKFGSVIIG